MPRIRAIRWEFLWQIVRYSNTALRFQRMSAGNSDKHGDSCTFLLRARAHTCARTCGRIRIAHLPSPPNPHPLPPAPLALPEGGSRYDSRLRSRLQGTRSLSRSLLLACPLMATSPPSISALIGLTQGCRPQFGLFCRLRAVLRSR